MAHKSDLVKRLDEKDLVMTDMVRKLNEKYVTAALRRELNERVIIFCTFFHILIHLFFVS